MIGFRKLLVYSFALIFILTSCEDNKISYNFIQRSTNGEMINRVDFLFQKQIKKRFKTYTYHINLRGKSIMSIGPGLDFSMMKYSSSSDIYLYPSFSDCPNGGNIEVIVYNKNPKAWETPMGYEMESASDVVAYYVCFVDGDKVYTVISKDRELNKTNVKEDGIDNSLFDTNFQDVTYIDFLDQQKGSLLKENNGFMGGIIVKSKIDGMILKLD